MIALLAALALTVAGSVAVRPFARWALATVAPARAVPLVAFAALSASLGTGIALTAVAVGYLAGWAPVAQLGHVQAAVLHRFADVPGWLGGPIAAGVAALLGAAVGRVLLILRQLYRAERFCRSVSGPEAMVFVDDPDIYAVSGIRGRILVGRALFEHLTPSERAVVLAHEGSHLRRRHHLYVHVVDVAVAANPILRGLPALIRLGVERWADEDAAATVADRTMAARTLARVAIARKRMRAGLAAALIPEAMPAGALGAATGDVALRVDALLHPAKPARRVATLALVLMFAAVLVAGVASLAHVDTLIEAAQSPFRR